MAGDDVQQWLQSGGDHRLIQGESGLSPYRVAMRPR